MISPIVAFCSDRRRVGKVVRLTVVRYFEGEGSYNLAVRTPEDSIPIKRNLGENLEN